ncbi:MAG TPA: ribbon-helix-helix protein, CopG family [Methylomirabilota bacterium]|nr:ribbon-helix-helix protein, CopG family [Methylomirabilota bacterium]
MGQDVTVTARVSRELKAKLDLLARQTNRSEAELANEALAAYVDVQAWHAAEIERSLAEVRAGAEGVPHDRIVAWLESWGTDDELPPP